MSELDIEGFMGHDPNAGSRGGFLKGWKKRQPPKLLFWLHTKTMFRSLWQHNLPVVKTIKDKETGLEKRVIWSQSFNCHEHESVLSDRKRDRDTGRRLSPIQVCPVCKLQEWLRGEHRAGRLGFAQPIFQFETGEASSDGSEETRIIHAGGFWGGFGDNMSNAERNAVGKAKISLKEAWKENGNSKCQYAFAIVDDEHPEEGIQIAIETSLVGDKMKAVLRQQKKKLGENGNWNPLATPYGFAWEHHPSAKAFGDRYEAYDMPGLKYREEIKALIEDEAAPDLARLSAPGRVRPLREQFERYCLVPNVPWDEIFGAAEAAQRDEKEDGDDATSFDYGYNVGEDVENTDAALDAARAAASTGQTQVQRPADPGPTAPAKGKPADVPGWVHDGKGGFIPKTQWDAENPPAPPAAPAPAPAQQLAAMPVSQDDFGGVEPPAAPVKSGRTKLAPAAPPPAPAFIAEYTPCDDCHALMRNDEAVCWNCGSKYGVTLTPEEAEAYKSLGPVPPESRVKPPARPKA